MLHSRYQSASRFWYRVFCVLSSALFAYPTYEKNVIFTFAWPFKKTILRCNKSKPPAIRFILRFDTICKTEKAYFCMQQFKFTKIINGINYYEEQKSYNALCCRYAGP